MISDNMDVSAGLMERMRSLREKEKMAKVWDVLEFPPGHDLKKTKQTLYYILDINNCLFGRTKWEDCSYGQVQGRACYQCQNQKQKQGEGK